MIRDWVHSGRIGRVTEVYCNYGHDFFQEDPNTRMGNPDLVGGALMDVGIYCVRFSEYGRCTKDHRRMPQADGTCLSL